MKRFRIPTVAILLFLSPLPGCGQESRDMKISGLSAITFNYSDEAIVSVRVDGELAGTGMEAARPGDLTSSGNACCISLNAGEHTLPVEIKPALADAYLVEAAVEHPVTKYPHYGVVHVLPGRKVVIAVTATMPAPRLDLLNARLDELGIAKELSYPPHLMDAGPEYDIE